MRNTEIQLEDGTVDRWSSSETQRRGESEGYELVTGDRADARRLPASTKGQASGDGLTPRRPGYRDREGQPRRYPQSTPWHHQQVFTAVEASDGWWREGEETEEERRSGASLLRAGEGGPHNINGWKLSNEPVTTKLFIPLQLPPFCPATGDLYFQGSFNAISKGGLINSQL